MNHRPLVFLDIETTGGSAHDSRITEIGALRVENGEVVRTYSQLLDPEQPVPAFITGLTGISTDMVRGQPTFAQIADELRQLLDGAIFVAHFVQFDYGFIKQEYARLGQAFNMDRLCTVRLDRRLYPEQPRHGLDKVIERMSLDVANRHRAYDDAEVLWKLFEHEYGRDKLELFRSMEKLLVYARQPAPNVMQAAGNEYQLKVIT
jgi:DNA polymerase-3 subunit epsilon